MSPLAAWALVLVTGGGIAWALGARDPLPEGDASRGERLYTLNCVQCHSPDGRGGRTPDGRLAPPVDDVSVSYVRLVLRTHRMPPGADPFDNRDRPARYGEQEMADVLAFMVTEFDLTGDVEAPAPGDAGRGQALYAANCAACHGPTGAGGVAGAGAWTPRIHVYDAQVIADAIRVGPFEMPRFAPELITDDDVGDIVAFLHEVDEEPGTLLFPGELNPVYASAFGALLTFAVLALVLVIAGKPLELPDPEDPEAEEGRDERDR